MRVPTIGLAMDLTAPCPLAGVLAQRLRDEQEHLMLQTDSHAPPRFRVRGALANMPEFAATFSCKPGDPMVRTEKERGTLW